MVLYEVNLKVKTEIATEYLSWLEKHIQEILTIPGFLSAKAWKLDAANNGFQEFTIHYFLDSRKSLETYLLNEAPKLRAEGMSRFGNSFSATRRVFEEIEKK